MSISVAQYQRALRGEVILMTSAGLAAIHDQLATLREEVLKLEGLLGYAAQDYPDLRENAIYGDLAMKIQLDLPRQTGDLKEMLARSLVVDNPPAARVSFGSVFDADINGTPGSFRLVGPAEVTYITYPDSAQVVSYLSPLGRAVWGGRPGETRTFATGSEDREVTIHSLISRN